MAHLPTVGTLDPRVVPRLWAVLGKVAKLIAVAALRLVGVARLVALLGHVLSGVTIATSPRGDIGALKIY